MSIEFTNEEIELISDKLEKAANLINEAADLVREKDDKGESELFTHLDSDYNTVTDTLSELWRYAHA